MLASPLLSQEKETTAKPFGKYHHNRESSETSFSHFRSGTEKPVARCQNKRKIKSRLKCCARVSLCTAARSRPCRALCPPVSLACLHHVLPRCIFFWLKSASSVLSASCKSPLAALARIGAILSVSIRAIGNSLTGLLSESLSSPHTCLSLRPGGSYTRKHTTTEPGVITAES